MDAKEFIKEKQRMCKYYNSKCHNCAVPYQSLCTRSVACIDEKLVDVVEMWSKEHPIKTNFNKLSDVVQGLFKGVKMTVTNDWDGNVGTVYIEAGAGYWDMVFKEEEEDG